MSRPVSRKLPTDWASRSSDFRAATVIVDFLHLPMPGNVLGMLMLFGLLYSGAVEEAWVADGAEFLMGHFSYRRRPDGRHGPDADPRTRDDSSRLRARCPAFLRLRWRNAAYSVGLPRGIPIACDFDGL